MFGTFHCGFFDPEGKEIKEKVHEVFNEQYHIAVLIVPDDQQRYQNDSRFLTDPNTGQVYATLGAGPEGGFGPIAENLVSSPNRPTDADLSTAVEMLTIDLKGRDENRIIEALFQADANYSDRLEYDLFPASDGQRSIFVADDGYNSNSYARGLIESVGLIAIQPNHSVPGFNKPVPPQEFQLQQVP